MMGVCERKAKAPQTTKQSRIRTTLRKLPLPGHVLLPTVGPHRAEVLKGASTVSLFL
jgi:hypothetical protein